MKTSIKLALLSAFLLWLAWPPIPYTSLLLLVAFVPLLFAIENIITSSSVKKGKDVFLIAGLTSLIWNTASIYWVFNAMNAVMPSAVAILISLIPFGLAALLMTLAFWLYYQLRKRYSLIISLIGLICFWISYEFLHQSWDLAFPWMSLGNGFAMDHHLIQWYEFTGVFGGSLWILLSNVLLFILLNTTKPILKNANKKVLISWLLIIIIPITISLIRYYTYEERINPADVVVVQPNVDPYEKFGSLPAEVQIKNLIRLSDSVALPNTEFFIWPETAIPEATNEATIRESSSFHQIQNFLDHYKNGSLLTGIESYLIYDSAKTLSATYYPHLNGYVDAFNAAVLIENSGKVQFYHKSKLVPGVEQLPFKNALAFMKPLFAAFGGTTGGYGSQKEASVFYTQSGIGAAPIICYESIWGNYIGDFVKQGAQFIAVITNDGWWGNTSGKDQHLAYAKLRAIETRRWVARSANTGISAFINQKGDIVKKTKWWTADAINQEINLNEALTFYVKTGDYIAYLAAFGSLLFGGLILLRLKKKIESDG
jgi:apolipoprotein N-acyltransferase